MKKINTFFIFLCFAFLLTTPAKANLQQGQTAPDFTLKDNNGKTIRFADYLGKKTVLLFFMDLNDEFCQKKLLELTKRHPQTTILAINNNPASANKVYLFAKKNKIRIPILFDNNKKVSLLYKTAGKSIIYMVNMNAQISYQKIITPEKTNITLEKELVYKLDSLFKENKTNPTLPKEIYAPYFQLKMPDNWEKINLRQRERQRAIVVFVRKNYNFSSALMSITAVHGTKELLTRHYNIYLTRLNANNITPKQEQITINGQTAYKLTFLKEQSFEQYRNPKAFHMVIILFTNKSNSIYYRMSFKVNSDFFAQVNQEINTIILKNFNLLD